VTIGETIGIWVAALLTLSIFSFLYRDNAFFKAGEHIFLGVALAYGMVFAYYQTVYPQVVQKFSGPQAAHGADLILEPIIPVILGIFILLRIFPKVSWLSRLSFAVYVGGYAGLAVPNTIANLLLPQITSTMTPIGPDWKGVVTQLVLVVGVFSTLLFFFFSLEHRGTVGRISRVGVFFIMLAMGASFGNTVMARVSLLIGRVQFLLYDWIGRAILHHG
jgi:hypothetical protein